MCKRCCCRAVSVVHHIRLGAFLAHPFSLSVQFLFCKWSPASWKQHHMRRYVLYNQSRLPFCLRRGQFSILEPFFLLRASHRSWKSQQIINTAVTFLCELCLSSAPCSQMVLGRLSYCELPWLIVQHVLVNQACPQWQLLSRHYNELPKPL